jgi:hypothetical protein
LLGYAQNHLVEAQQAAENGLLASAPTMQFETVFDLEHPGFQPWSFPAFGFILVAISAFLVFAPTNIQPLVIRKFWDGRGRDAAWIFFAFALAWFIASIFGASSTWPICATRVFRRLRGQYLTFIRSLLLAKAMEASMSKASISHIRTV